MNPGPATDKIQFSGIEVELVEVLYSSGKIYLSKRVDSDQSVDVSYLPTGFYFIHCQLVNGHYITKKLIKK